MSLARNSSFALLLAVLFAPSVAVAALVPLSGDITFWDRRDNRDDDSVVTQATNATNRPAHNVFIETWERKGVCIDLECYDGVPDTHLGSAWTTNSGGYSTYVQDGHWVYYRFTNASRDAILWASDDTRVTIFSDAFQVPIGSPSGSRNWSITCNREFTNTTIGRCDSTSDVTAYFAGNEVRANVVVSASDVHRYMGSVRTLSNPASVRLYVDQMPPSQGSTSCAGTAFTFGQDHVCIGTTGYGRSNHTVAHEIGHAFHARLLDVDSLGDLDDSDCSLTWSSECEGEKQLTYEGFASALAGMVYWSQGSSTTSPWFLVATYKLAGLTDLGNSGSNLACVSSGSTPHLRMGNVARFFWDLYDSHSDSDGTNTDNASTTASQIASEWGTFLDGTSNRRDGESDCSGCYDDGRNVWDYVSYETSYIGEAHLNCLTSQSEPL